MERMLATPADAEIIIKLYDLRRESVMREARAWVGGEFWPATADDLFAVLDTDTDTVAERLLEPALDDPASWQVGVPADTGRLGVGLSTQPCGTTRSIDSKKPSFFGISGSIIAAIWATV